MDKILDWFEGFGMNSAWILVALGVGLIALVISTIDLSVGRSLGYAIVLSPVWLPLVLFFLFFEFWMDYVQKKYVLAQGRTTLEIRLPQEIFKSPLAMELVLIQLYQTASPDNLVQTYWDGKHPPTFGLEMVSDGGRIRFFINTPTKKFKNLVEAQLYAQYPGIEVVELPVDYTAAVPYDLERYPLFSMHFGLKKDTELPIKTYIDFGLDKSPKEEEKTDPITSMMDMLGSMNSHERVWIQILISAHREENFEVGSLFKKPDWKDSVKKKIDELAQRDTKTKEGPVEFESAPRVTPGERSTIEALERSLSKYPFNTAIRGMYIAEEGHFNPDRIGAIIGSWRQYDDVTRNQIGIRWRTDYNWIWWQDPTGKKVAAHKKRELDEYKKRVYFNQSKDDKKFIMTTEELATIFHLPGSVALTPTLDRIPSTRAEPPVNLPRGE